MKESQVALLCSTIFLTNAIESNGALLLLAMCWAVFFAFLRFRGD